MAITYEELGGSPSFVMDRDGGSATRIVKVAWSDIGRAILEIFPGAAFGYPYTASVPGFPWLRAHRMAIDPWDGEGMTGNGEGMNTYPGGAKLTVDYVPFKWPDREHDDGPAGAELQDITFLEQKLTFGGEYLTWPNNGVRWNNAVGTDDEYSPNSGGVAGAAAQADKNFKVFEDVNVGVTIPTIEHSLVWSHVRRPPWLGIRNCLGKVNSVKHMNCQPETLLFTGATAERAYSTQGAPTWKLEYRISEKCVNYPLRLRYKLFGLIITDGGTSYAVGDKLAFVGGEGKPATMVVTTVAPGGIVTGANFVQTGEYYSLPARPALVSSTTGEGSGCRMTAGSRVLDTEPAHGWNYFLRPETGRFEKMVRKDGTSIYRTAAFRQLYGGRA